MHPTHLVHLLGGLLHSHFKPFVYLGVETGGCYCQAGAEVGLALNHIIAHLQQPHRHTQSHTTIVTDVVGLETHPTHRWLVHTMLRISCPSQVPPSSDAALATCTTSIEQRSRKEMHKYDAYLTDVRAESLHPLQADAPLMPVLA